jgi:hypothetical protein
MNVRIMTENFFHLSRGERSMHEVHRVRGYALTIDSTPSPQPLPTGEGADLRRRGIASKLTIEVD